MKFALLISGGPSVQAPRSALRFAEAAVATGHGVPRVFFYRDAVHLARLGTEPAAGERDITLAWSDFAKTSGAELLVCVAAAQRRALAAADLAPGFTLAGLGQLIDAATGCDRLLTFAG